MLAELERLVYNYTHTQRNPSESGLKSLIKEELGESLTVTVEHWDTSSVGDGFDVIVGSGGKPHTISWNIKLLKK